MITDELLGNISSDLGSLFSKVKESVSKVSSKIPAQAKTAAAMTPQGQAVMAAQSMASKQKSGGTSTAKTSVIPVPGKSGGTSGKISNMFSGLTKKKIFGIPVIIPILGVFVGLPMLKKFTRKR